MPGLLGGACQLFLKLRKPGLVPALESVDELSRCRGLVVT
jgi:hypothetical protein